MTLAERYASALTRHSRLVVVALLLATAAVGYGAAGVDGGITIAQFESDSAAAEKLDYLRANFETEGENATTVQVVVRGKDALAQSTMVDTLRFQAALRSDPDVAPTLRDSTATVGLANLVAGTAAGSTGQPPPETPSAQADLLASLSAEEYRTALEAVLDPARETRGPVDPYALLPTSYEPGSTTASAQVLFVFQESPEGESLPESVVEGQLAMRDVADATVDAEAFVFGAGVVDAESTAATGESFAVIGPFALVLILLVLGWAYRDVVDVLLGLLGVALVLVWMAGVMGWAGIGVTQILIAVPFLLIGLAIDYALHVVMRYREARSEDADAGPREGMRRGLGGVVVALAATTVTTAVGFSSNALSPITAIREFGLVAAAGIVSAFVVFAGLLPAMKLEVDGSLERVGLDRRSRAVGTGGGPASRVLQVGTGLARRAPVAVVLVALVVSAGGAVAATDIDTSLNQVDFLPRDSPEWMDSLPGPLRPGDYRIREHADYLNDNFVQARQASTVEFLVEGPVTDPDTLQRLAAARGDLRASETAIVLASGDLDATGPLDAIEQAAAANDSVAALVAERDGDGDGVPDSDLATVYDAVYATVPDAAAATIERRDGEYRSLRLAVSVRGGADTGTVTREMRAVAGDLESGSGLEATATGQPIVTELVQRGLLRTLVETFLVTLGVILAFLSAIFYRRYRTPLLGAVTLVPVVFALSWILGVMYLAGINFNTETAIIASIAIGIGVDYAIHVSERFLEERGRALTAGHAGDEASVVALERTVAGTGGALLASALTTAAGFGVLTLALVPSLRRFGFVTATAIAFAFVASVLVLPSLLVLWERRVDHEAPN